jgi:hypothetical protein
MAPMPLLNISHETSGCPRAGSCAGPSCMTPWLLCMSPRRSSTPGRGSRLRPSTPDSVGSSGRVDLSEFGDGSMSTLTDVEVLTVDDPAITPDLPDLLPWDRRPSTQMIPEKSAIASPYLGGSDQKPRDIRTLRRWRESRRGPSFLKIGGRYFYTIGALRDFYQRSIRGGVG